MTASLAGTVIDGRWALEARIASGSFASVYRAIDQQTGEQRAVKILTEVATDEAQQRFRAEFEALGRLVHPHIVRGHAVGTLDGRPYMVLDLVAGGNVLSLVNETGAMTPDRACVLGVQVLSALAEAHARGVIHRDVKPGNVLVDDAGDALLCDFGIARVETDGKAWLTQVGSSLGTLLYMAPEQRLDAHNVDLTADLYGVGCLLYRLVTEETPADLFSAPPDSPRWAPVPEGLRAVIVRATSPSPAQRWPDARSMAEALLLLLPADEQAAVRARPGSDPARFPVPDPRVRVGTFLDEPTDPYTEEAPKVRAPKGRKGPVAKGTAPGAKPNGAKPNVTLRVSTRPEPPPDAGSPWPWRIGVAVVAVVVIAVVGMVLGI